MVIAFLILLGLCFGSFVNALVWRVYQQSLPAKRRKAGAEQLSVTKGRSMCVRCGHELQAADLLPVLSWLALRGKCRYCRKPITWQYPIVETATAALFVISYAYWPYSLEEAGIASFVAWLAVLVGLVALVIYDLRWMLLPNRIIFPLYGMAALYVVSRIVAAGSPLEVLAQSAAGVVIGGGIFYGLFQISGGRWIGGGDVKLGFLVGAIVGGPINAMLLIFIASLLGSLAVIPLAVLGKSILGVRIPFGPFLIAGAFVVQLWGAAITDWYIANIINI